MPRPRKQKSHSSRRVLQALQYSKVWGHPHGDSVPHVAVMHGCVISVRFSFWLFWFFGFFGTQTQWSDKLFKPKCCNLQCVVVFSLSSGILYVRHGNISSFIIYPAPLFYQIFFFKSSLKNGFAFKMQHNPHVKFFPIKLFYSVILCIVTY